MTLPPKGATQTKVQFQYRSRYFFQTFYKFHKLGKNPDPQKYFKSTIIWKKIWFQGPSYDGKNTSCY